MVDITHQFTKWRIIYAVSWIFLLGNSKLTVINALRMTEPIGFIGLGIMGKGMAQNLLKKIDNCSLVVWNRSPDACAELSAAFPPGRVTVAASAADVVRSCKLTYSMLSTMEASEAVFDHADGVINAMGSDKTLVDCATLSPERMMLIAAEIDKRGGKFLEAPVSGSKVPAETGTLIFLCGGDAAIFEAASPGLQAMGKASFLLGPVGAGSKMKLVVNMIMGTMMGAFAEGMALAETAELPQDMLLQVIHVAAGAGIASNVMSCQIALCLAFPNPNLTSPPHTHPRSCAPDPGPGRHGKPHVQG